MPTGGVAAAGFTSKKTNAGTRLYILKAIHKRMPKDSNVVSTVEDTDATGEDRERKRE